MYEVIRNRQILETPENSGFRNAFLENHFENSSNEVFRR